MAKDFDKVQKESTAQKGNNGNKYFEHRPEDIQNTPDDFALAADSSLTEFDIQRRGTEKQNSRNQVDILRHSHDGINSVRVNVENLDGLVETLNTGPTFMPRRFFDQFKVYKNGATYRLYVYDAESKAWRYATLT